ncbi:MAG: hypothetical protein H7338_14105 [Candidatus Sericytochromatia bacterium]|nr:hypothetical protein [Candidatus Sericytochromatia bacterium]
MALIPDAGTGLQLILAGLALYHLGIGVVAALSGKVTAKAVRGLYGLHLVDSPAFRYATKMLGLYGLTLGGLLANAALNPPAHRDVIVAIIGLQSLRAGFRLMHRRLLAEACAVTARDNLMGVSLLLIEIVLLVAFFPQS